MQRIRFLASLALFALIVAACGPTDWPAVGHDAGRSASSPDTSISKDAVATGSLELKWTAGSGGIVANGVLYSGSAAYDAAGNANCTGSAPKTCSPLWTYSVGSISAIADSRAFGIDRHTLYAFDATGNTNCSGTPKTCAPLWQTAMLGDISTPVVDSGVVVVPISPYVPCSGSYVCTNVAAFEATGGTNCSGTPNVCTPIWTRDTDLPAISELAAANGLVYWVSDDFTLFAHPVRGNSYRWFGGAGYNQPLVANGVLYTGGAAGAGDANALAAVDAGTGSFLWSAKFGGGTEATPRAVGDGVLYVTVNDQTHDNTLYAFDAAGNTNCLGTGVSKTCTPMWTVTPAGPAAISNGVLYVGADKLYAYDANGVTNCSGSPKTCTPLWTAPARGAPTIANGLLYVGSSVYGLEKVPPTTSIVIPSNGATLSGASAQLDASASDNVKVSRVEFHLTGGDYNDALIGTASLYPGYGYIYYWNTATVPNGTYTLNSVAYDPAGNVGRSANVSITVRN